VSPARPPVATLRVRATPSTRASLRTAVLLGLVVAIVVAGGGCAVAGGGQPGTTPAKAPAVASSVPSPTRTPSPEEAASDAWWYWLGFGGLWGLSFDSLQELAKGADAVVIARIVQAGPGPVEGQIGPDGWDDRVFYTSATIEIERVISGHVPSARVTMHFLSPNPARFADQLRAYPKERAIFFITDLYRTLTEDYGNPPGPELERVRGIYVWTIPGAVVRDLGGIARPLLQLTGQPYLVALDGRAFDEVVSTIAGLAN
jgi:hypothetical protein